MSYTSWSVVFNEQPSTSKWNILGSNDASFNDGSGLPTTNSTTARVSASQTTTSTSYTDLSTTGPAVTATVGSSGKAYIEIYCGTIQNDTNAAYSLAAFAVSGANTIAAADSGANMFNIRIRNAAASVVGDWAIGAGQLLTSLTPGSTTFTMKYRVAVGGTGTFAERKISVITL